MRRLLVLLCLLLLLTACAPQSAPAEPMAAPTPTASPVPTPALLSETALHETLDHLAPQTLNMFRPFTPIEMSPEQFMEEMAAIRALPFEKRNDWLVEHDLCIPQPSQDTDVDWQLETNLWSSYADFRTAVAGEPIHGSKDGMPVTWQFVYSDPATPGGALRCSYAVLFEREESKPWVLTDVLYRPQVWQGSHEEHTLFVMDTKGTTSIYDPAQRGIVLTVPDGELDIETGDTVTRYATDCWDYNAEVPLWALSEKKYACISMLYERYPAGQVEWDKRQAFGGYALIYTMANHRPVLVRDVLQESCDPDFFLGTKAEEFLRSDYACPVYSAEYGDFMEEKEFALTGSRALTMRWIAERKKPLTYFWRDNTLPYTRIVVLESGKVLQTISFDEIARLCDEHPETGGGYTQYDAFMPYMRFFERDINLDGFSDLFLCYDFQQPSNYKPYGYYLIWDEQRAQFVFWRVIEEQVVIDPDARTITYENGLSNYSGQHIDRILPDGSIVHDRLTMYSRTQDSADVYWQVRKWESCDPHKEFIWQNDGWIEAQP